MQSIMLKKEIKLSKKFDKAVSKRFGNNKNKLLLISDRIALFKKDRSNKILKDHALVGALEGVRSFSVSGDIRIYRFNSIYRYRNS